MKSLLLALCLVLPLSAHAGQKPSKAEREAVASATQLHLQAIEEFNAADGPIPGRLEKAELHVRKALELHPSPPWTLHQTLALVLFSSPELRPEVVDVVEAAVAAYAAAPPDPPDAGVLTLAAMGASTAGLLLEDPARALALIDTAQALEPGLAGAKGIAEGSETLAYLELDLLMRAPGREAQVEPAFEALLGKQPDAAQLWLVRGQWLLDRDVPAAREALETALAKGADPVPAHFMLGSTWVNEASAIQMAMNNSEDFDSVKAMQPKLADCLAKARPHFEAVVAAKPDDLESVRQLLNIAVMTEDTAGAKRWWAEKERLQGGR